MKGFLLDTCAVSEFAKPSPNLGLVQWLSRVDPTILFLSALTIGELRYGIEKRRDANGRERLEKWLASDVLVDFRGRILAIDANVCQRWGSARARAQRAGKAIPSADGLIAATAIEHNLTLLTRNEADFVKLNVSVVNPWN